MVKAKKSKTDKDGKILISKKLKCVSCSLDKKVPADFYISNNRLHPAGRIPYCKTCLRKMISNDNGSVSLDKLKDTLQLIDKPYMHDLWQSSLAAKGDAFGVYMKNIYLNFKKYKWTNSRFTSDQKQEMNYSTFYNASEKFEITNEIVTKWGVGYRLEEYESFERKYELLKNNYAQVTAMHTEALLKYIRYSVKEELATAANEVADAKSWGALAKDAATAAKINPSQLSKADLSDGLSTFSELTQALEREVDIIPILPRFKFRPNDAIDFNIWCYVNYIRDLQGLPPCSYEEVYAFYDRKVASYIKQYGDPYGIFTNDPTKGNRKNIRQFLNDDDYDVTKDDAEEDVDENSEVEDNE